MSDGRATDRIVALDILRGVAVMGILAMNILSFALPSAAATNPYAVGQPSGADLTSWFLSFVFIEGKMRGLFSLLFGASMVLVIERAEGAGRSGGRTHAARMIWLLLFGLLHHYLVWHGDILVLYAVIGLFALAFWQAGLRALLIVAGVLLLGQFCYFALIAASIAQIGADAASPEAPANFRLLWDQVRYGLRPYSAAEFQLIADVYRGGYGDLLAWTLSEKMWDPVDEIQTFGLETLAYFLLGMAGYRSGFLSGGWSMRAYRRVALVGFGVGVPLEVLIASHLLASGFAVSAILSYDFAAGVLIRPLMIAATAALIILLASRGGALVDRIAAAGRAAFTNYLGTSLLMTFIFYGWGLGLFGVFGRVQLWLPVLAAWAIMLAWSRPWLQRFRYGPFEWAWRSLARGAPAPMRRSA